MVHKLLALLDTLWRWVNETPSVAHTLRYGNPAYRAWFARMAEAAPQVRAAFLLCKQGERGRVGTVWKASHQASTCSTLLAAVSSRSGLHSWRETRPVPRAAPPPPCSWSPRCCLQACRELRRSCLATWLTASATQHASTMAQASRALPCALWLGLWALPSGKGLVPPPALPALLQPGGPLFACPRVLPFLCARAAGHETTFCALLYCLARLGVVDRDDAQALVTRVFARYLQLMRKLQVSWQPLRATHVVQSLGSSTLEPPFLASHARTGCTATAAWAHACGEQSALPQLWACSGCLQTTYWLEPAGSHGVWGLDDYQFLPFVWGSAQVNCPPAPPRSLTRACRGAAPGTHCCAASPCASNAPGSALHAQVSAPPPHVPAHAHPAHLPPHLSCRSSLTTPSSSPPPSIPMRCWRATPASTCTSAACSLSSRQASCPGATSAGLRGREVQAGGCWEGLALAENGN